MWRHPFKVIAFALLVVTIGIFLTGCGSSTPKLTSISVFGDTSAPLTRGSSVQFHALGNYSNGTQGTLNGVNWSSADNSVATVSATGLVTGVLRGSADIVATYNNMRASRTITIKGLAGATIGPDGGTITVDLPNSPSN